MDFSLLSSLEFFIDPKNVDRRKVIYNQYKEDIRDIIKQLCSYKGVEIIEGHLMPSSNNAP